MANHRELTAARAAGLSPSRLARPVAGAAGLLIVIAFLAQTYGIPYWERMALRLRAEVTQTDLDGSGTERSEEHTSELQSLMRISYAVFCLKKKRNTKIQ